MNPKISTLFIIITALSSEIALGAPAERAGEHPGGVAEAIMGLLPLLLFLAILYWLLRRYMKSSIMLLTEQYMRNQMEHNRRVEELMERVAKALETK